MDQTKRCPMCGEVIFAEAVRCRFCQADILSSTPRVSVEAPRETAGERPVARPAEAAPAPSTPGSGPTRVPLTVEEFELRFLDFAYTTDRPIHAPTVAYALKIAIDEASERLEDLAARDILLREVDERGLVFFHLPGRHAGSSPVRSPTSSLALRGSGDVLEADRMSLDLTQIGPPPPTEGTALAAILVNTLCLPGLGSIIGGRPGAGIGQLLLVLFGLPLCFVLVGVPMVLSAWIWALITGVDIMNQAKQAQAQKRLDQSRLP